MIYTIHPYSRYLSLDSKNEFLRTVDRKNRYTKLYDLIENSEYFRLEIIYNYNYFDLGHYFILVLVYLIYYLSQFYLNCDCFLHYH